MPHLRTVQTWSVLAKAGTTALGIVQTAIVLRLLGPEAYGIVGIVLALGTLVGVSQHVGAVDAAIREIAIADAPARRAGIFWVSLWSRLAVTIPISLLLAGAADWIGTRVYPFPDLPALVRLMSIILILHGVQGILGGVFSGRRAFGVLYVFQLVTAAVNIPIFSWFVRWHGTVGFFEAVAVAALIFIVLLAIPLRRVLGGTLAHPSLSVSRDILRDVMHTGGWTYLARILSVAWQRVPVLALGRWASPEVVGIFSAALTFGSKLQILAAALGEVNLAYVSSAFVKGQDAFRRLAHQTLRDVAAGTLVGSLFLMLFADLLVRVLAGAAYAAAIPLIAVVTWGWAAFAFLDIATNSVFVPARQSQLRAVVFAVMFAVTMLIVGALRPIPLTGVTVGMLAGSVAALAVGDIFASARLTVGFVPRSLWPPVVVAAGLSILSPSLSLPVRGVLFAAFAFWVSWIAFARFRATVRTVVFRHAH